MSLNVSAAGKGSAPKHSEPRVFAFAEGQEFGTRLSQHLGIDLSQLEERQFEDGEHKLRPLENVRNTDVYVLQSLYGDAEYSVNDKLCRLLFFIGALKEASARRVTAVLPYLCYARKDRQTKARDPVNTRYVACLLEAVGVDHVVTVDVHNLAAFQNAFRCATDHIEAKSVFVDYFAALATGHQVTVMSPDIGGIKRAEQFRQALAKRLDTPVGSAFMDKQRSAGVISGEAVVGDVQNKTVIIIDDLISTGSTLVRAADACHRHGAHKIYAVATHGLFVDGADQLLSNPHLEKVVVTNSLPPFRVDADRYKGKLEVIDIAELLADVIRRMYNGGSIVELSGD